MTGKSGRLWLPVLLWLAFISFMSTASFSKENTFAVIGTLVNSLFPGLDTGDLKMVHKMIRKTAHVFEYFVLGLLLLRVFQDRTPEQWTWRASFFSLLGVLIWAVADEYHQSLVASRQASVNDVIIDATGGLLAQFAGAVWYRLRRVVAFSCS